MLFLPVLFLLPAVLCGVSAVESPPTYEHQDPLTGKILRCDKCPPGTHMAAHCTATKPTQCLPCRENHFTDLWNYLPKCLYCKNLCNGNQEVERECSSVSDRVCRCKEGFYLFNDFCMAHSECEPGEGVKTKGTSELDTVCEKCPDGYFSSSSSATESCVKQQECPCGQTVLLPGSIYHNTLCGSCEDFANGGETPRKFYARLFSMHRTPRAGKLRKFVARYIRKSGEETLPQHKGPLLDEIREWLDKASVEELKKLPEMLKAVQLNSMTEKLEKRLDEIEQTLNCSLSL
ncbi:tumor necrosis factor receptor superfamily member 6B-like [Thunnus maccoyii]|uniref:tumor necrosis factor receptor superfamily member 6B-like n=1 Tax=Thunnus maccoyii TaxID=8240 RepID=UPI001C4BF808|nr:tumor necrosis factor receptor superfamily member 6B-like [Thunnus maccoyii]